MIFCTLVTKQNVRYKKTANTPPLNITGDRMTSKDNDATVTVPPKTRSAQNDMERNEPNTKAKKTRKGKKPRTTKMTKNRHIKGWFSRKC